MEPSDFWDDVSNCRCGDRLMTLEQRASRQHQRCLAHSLVGTPNYIAPEVLLRKGRSERVGLGDRRERRWYSGSMENITRELRGHQ